MHPILPPLLARAPAVPAPANDVSAGAARRRPDVAAPAPVADAASLRVAVVVASLGRPELITQMQELMARQCQPPDRLLFSVTGAQDLPSPPPVGNRIEIVTGPKGLCAQRNTALDQLGRDYDVIVFYDDDFIPAPDSMARIREFFASHPDVAGATGHVIADGINSPGIDFAKAQQLLQTHGDAHERAPNCIVTDLAGLYGCNMAYRTAAIGTQRFDERLKLYAWQEDIDFAASLRPRGRIVKTFAFCGVHQGVKHGRTPGVRLGYSQVINPCYLVHKGTMPLGFALRLVLGNLMANHVKILRPEPWVDRRGRAWGNWIGLFDLIRGRLTPERIETL
ncbi:glycosyltransferase family 2 protein [Novosphingobium sp. MBES04]|uniref:glycosyltransferase family 2 protein n=1 Tax=Novosphingobium sp. MBES04 TaxID=1206458 RepID=UPI0007236828|nr:glycosyltransferase family 2 protein [Novosphingobium sp. MBES04]GAM05788.1 group 1 glycosyl transferase [Novosphingobium sp. MBES04]